MQTRMLLLCEPPRRGTIVFRNLGHLILLLTATLVLAGCGGGGDGAGDAPTGGTLPTDTPPEPDPAPDPSPDPAPAPDPVPAPDPDPAPAPDPVPDPPANTQVPPTVSLTDPLDGDTLAASPSASIHASADDADGLVSKVEFFIDGVSVGIDTTAPYSISWDAGAGSYALSAVATDDDGNITASSSQSVEVIVNTAPNVALKGFNPDDVYVGPTDIVVAADAVDVEGNLSEVSFYANGNFIGAADTEPFE